jgi:hypothetical protein
LGNVAAGALRLLFAAVLDLGRVAVFGLALAARLTLAAGLDLVAGLDVAFRDGDLARLTVPALDLVFVLLLVFVALAFADFVYFLATMRNPSASYGSRPRRVATPSNQTTTKVEGQAGNGDRNVPAEIISLHGATLKRYSAVGRGRQMLHKPLRHDFGNHLVDVVDTLAAGIGGRERQPGFLSDGVVDG